MLKSRLGLLLGGLAIMLLASIAGAGVSSASVGPGEFMAQARAAGLSAEEAKGLQAKVDDYLAKLGRRATQVSPNQIDLKGAVLSVTVPGEVRPRQLAAATSAQYNSPSCRPYTLYGWFCAFQYEAYAGDTIGMWSCYRYSIPWASTGSWTNNQTPGTQPRAYFTNGTTWDMPPAFSYQGAYVNWAPVVAIRNC